MKIFKDRIAAGKLLARRLKQYKGMGDAVVLGIPRGGVVVAKEVAKTLNLPLDSLVVRKIGAPFQPELALGALDPDGEVVWDQRLLGEVGIAKEDLEETVKMEKEEFIRRENLYRQNKTPLDLDGKIVILVDDGIATGSTVTSSVRFLKRHGAKKIILATPVASKEALEKIVRELGEFGEVLVLETPQYFQAVGQFYHQFEPVEDEEVVEILRYAQDDNKG